MRYVLEINPMRTWGKDAKFKFCREPLYLQGELNTLRDSITNAGKIAEQVADQSWSTPYTYIHTYIHTTDSCLWSNNPLPFKGSTVEINRVRHGMCNAFAPSILAYSGSFCLEKNI